jgi:hypothetical protein
MLVSNMRLYRHSTGKAALISSYREVLFSRIWDSALPYLKRGSIKKDFVLHTKGVETAMRMLLQQEEGNPLVLIPAAILHDVGWADVPEALQKSQDKAEKERAMKLHILNAPSIIREILRGAYPGDKVGEIIGIVQAHKFAGPEALKELSKQLLIDADNLSDFFKDQLLSDAQSYGYSPQELLDYRAKEAKFHTATAYDIFLCEVDARKTELGI